MADSMKVAVPDIGDVDGVEVVEVLVATGDRVQADQSLITLESDKASMEVPSPSAGTVGKVLVRVGDTVSTGDPILELEVADGAAATSPAKASAGDPEPADAGSASAADPAPRQTPARASGPGTPATPAARPSSPPGGAPQGGPSSAGPATRSPASAADLPYASPAVRKLARERGVDLTGLRGSGRNGRIVREDVERATRGGSAGQPAGTAAGAGIPPMPAIDFSQFGEVEITPLTRINRLTGQNLHRSWLNVPHVTQFDLADITELEAFRKDSKGRAEARGVKLTFVSFLLAAAAAALREFPRFNASLDATGENLVVKKFINIGVAVDTPNGLVVPVIRDVDRKRVLDLAAELGEVSVRAREGKLTPRDIQGGTFTISSLGGIGGTAFNPIVNAPEVSILGVSRASMQPVWDGSQFVPRLMLPLSLSYDHRVIDGAAAARFTTYLGEVLGDIRTLLL